MVIYISFKDDTDGLVANDAFEAIVSEYEFKASNDSGWFDNDAGVSIKNTYDALEIRAKEGSVAEDTANKIAYVIKQSYSKYNPAINVGYDFDESMKPSKGKFAESFKLLKNRNLRKTTINEAVNKLKNAGYKLLK